MGVAGMLRAEMGRDGWIVDLVLQACHGWPREGHAPCDHSFRLGISRSLPAPATATVHHRPRPRSLSPPHLPFRPTPLAFQSFFFIRLAALCYQPIHQNRSSLDSSSYLYVGILLRNVCASSALYYCVPPHLHARYLNCCYSLC